MFGWPVFHCPNSFPSCNSVLYHFASAYFTHKKCKRKLTTDLSQHAKLNSLSGFETRRQSKAFSLSDFTTLFLKFGFSQFIIFVFLSINGSLCKPSILITHNWIDLLKLALGQLEFRFKPKINFHYRVEY